MNVPDTVGFSVLAVVPVFNHGEMIAATTQGILKHGIHCLLVDDGSHADCAAVLDALVRDDPVGLSLLRLDSNRGKGGAVMAGLREASRRGHSHVLQIDADGQHRTDDIPGFIADARSNPGHVIVGKPVYDASVPKGRLYGRYATHVWVWINTLSFDIRDTMCGFRIYPLPPTIELIDAVSIGTGMQFDTEILVRLYWRGVPVINRATPVSYPADGVSHFRMFKDNVLISGMHARLFFGMLARLPARLLGYRWPR